MSAQVLRAAVVTTPIDAASHEALVTDSRAGAIVSFAGLVRDHDGGRSVARLDYEAHPSAGEIVTKVAQEAADRHDVVAIAVSHRVGPLAIGDAALVVAVAAAHRREAFIACADVVDEVKRLLPVWKLQVFTDGTQEWTGCA